MSRLCAEVRRVFLCWFCDYIECSRLRCVHADSCDTYILAGSHVHDVRQVLLFSLLTSMRSVRDLLGSCAFCSVHGSAVYIHICVLQILQPISKRGFLSGHISYSSHRVRLGITSTDESKLVYLHPFGFCWQGCVYTCGSWSTRVMQLGLSGLQGGIWQ